MKAVKDDRGVRTQSEQKRLDINLANLLRMTEGSELGSVSVRKQTYTMRGLPKSEQKRLRFVLGRRVVLCRENTYECQ